MTDGSYFYPQPSPADTFIATLRESLVQFDERLTDLERLGGLVHKSLVAVEKRLDELDARFDESPREAAHRELKKAALHHAAMARAQAVGEHEHHREGEAPADFLAPPLPWWARSPKIG